MRKLRKTSSGFCTLIGMLAVGLFGGVKADVIYSHSFSGDGSSSLIGTAPDTTQPGEVWQGLTDGAQWTTDGKMTSTAAQSRYVYLDFSPESGKEYTLSVEVSLLATLRAFHMGFLTGVPVEGEAFSTTSLASPWMRLQGNRETWAMVGTSTGGDQTTRINGYASLPNTLQIVLDTTQPAWSVEWFLNGSSISTHTYASNPAIIGVGFGRLLEGNFDVDNFELSVIPEPVSIGLIGMGGLGLILFRRVFKS